MKVSQEPGFVLHTYKYRETSLILELFSRHYGRISVLAKGIRRWKKRGANHYLRPFQQFLFSWSGKGELATLVSAEELPPLMHTSKLEIYCGFYLNELMMRLLHKHDPHEVLYDYYQYALGQLQSGVDVEPILRVFEKRLLEETGYGLNLDTDINTSQPIQMDERYQYHVNRGPTLAAATSDIGVEVVSGHSLIALKNETLDDRALRELKTLMRRIIDQQLNHKPLVSRSMFRTMTRANPEHCKVEG